MSSPTYIPTIGLEIHVELKTASKMFCSCANDPDEKHPNTNVCPVCMGHPGNLPVPNKEAIEKLMKVGMALNCKIAQESKFDRKNYFYPDLPKGYQISQYDIPLCGNGELEIKISDGSRKKIGIERIHMEEDAGKLMHSADGKHSLVDYNRAGVPLMELVTKPDLTSPQEIEAFAKELRLLIRYLGASDVDMEKGQMRVEVNLSIAKPGEPWGTKVEVKNINSISAAVKAAEFEIARQTQALETGERLVQETRGWDDVHLKTVSQRIKEGSADYRYFPEPDIPPLHFTDDDLVALKSRLPEIPEHRRQRFAKLYQLTEAQIEVCVVSKHLGDYFEGVASELGSWDQLKHLNRPHSDHLPQLYTLAANYIITEYPPLFNLATRELDDISGLTIKPVGLADLITRIFHGELSSTNAKIVLREMKETGDSPDNIIRAKDLAQISDEITLREIVHRVIDENPGPVEQYKNGKTDVIKFLVGKAMAATKGRGNPAVLGRIFEEVLT